MFFMKQVVLKLKIEEYIWIIYKKSETKSCKHFPVALGGQTPTRVEIGLIVELDYAHIFVSSPHG